MLCTAHRIETSQLLWHNTLLYQPTVVPAIVRFGFVTPKKVGVGAGKGCLLGQNVSGDRRRGHGNSGRQNRAPFTNDGWALQRLVHLGKLIYDTRVLIIIHQRQVGPPKALLVVDIQPITRLRPAPPRQLVGVTDNNTRCGWHNAAQPASCAARPQPQQPVLQPILRKGFVQ